MATTRSHARPRIYLSVNLDEATAQAVYESADECKLSVSAYTREVLREHIAARREQLDAARARLQDSSTSAS